MMISLFLFCGCQPNQYNGEGFSEPLKVDLQCEAAKSEEGHSFPALLFFPEVAEVVSGTLDGQVLGFLYRKDGKTSRSLYLIDPAKKSAEKVYEPPSGYRVSAAVAGGNHLALVVRDKKSWHLLLRQLTGDQELLVDEGEFFKVETGDDYPSLSLSASTLAYNVTRKGEETFVSQIVRYDLATGRKETIFQVAGRDVYTGPPSACGRYITWHRGVWDREGTGEMYLYDAWTGTTRRLDLAGNNITPAIWGRYIAYVTYDEERPATKNIGLYNLVTGETERLTDATPDNEFEYWKPTLAHGVVCWFGNHRVERVPLFIVRQRDFENRVKASLVTEIKSPAYGARVLPSWITWHESTPQRVKKGTYFAGLLDLWPLVDLAGVDVAGEVDPEEIFEAVDQGKKGLAELEPPEAAALYDKAIEARRFDLVASLTMPGITSVEEWVEELKKEPPSDVPTRVSQDYLVQGNRAYVLAYPLPEKEPEGRLLHMTRENGIWKMDQCAAQ